MNSKWSRLCLGGSFLFATLGVHGPRLLADTIGSTGAKTASAALFAAAGRAAQAQPEVQPAATPPASAATQASIVAFEGKVRYRLGADKEWLPAKVGAILAEGAEVETGLRSAIQIRIGTGQVLTIDRASRVAIREAIARAGTEKTTVDLPYGRVKFEVSSASVANDVKIQAPDATLAVKGT
ncbi:MAG: FecR domain-containing protein, partial [Phycisphaerae bacterium]|nr:FecR domain-containing protein [Phycisphaerae bacterium]